MRRSVSPLAWFALAGAVIAADQLTKLWAEQALADGWIRVCSFFNLVLLYNTGSAFSLLADAGGWQKVVFSLFALAVSAVMAVMILKTRSSLLMNAACSLVMAGAIGNVIDRLRAGAVTDFLDFHIGALHWPAFNVADMAIVVGVALIAWCEFKKPSQEKR